MLAAVQRIDALDLESARAVAFDLRAHLLQEFREVADFGFAGGALDNRQALGARGGHHDVIGAEHGRAKFTAEKNLFADEFALGIWTLPPSLCEAAPSSARPLR